QLRARHRRRTGSPSRGRATVARGKPAAGVLRPVGPRRPGMNEPGECRVYLSTGEASGDAHAAHLAHALRRTIPGVEIDGTGGPLMAAAGVHLRHSISTLGASGLFEAARSFPHHLAVFNDLRRQFRQGRYDLLIVVDYPG